MLKVVSFVIIEVGYYVFRAGFRGWYEVIKVVVFL